MSKHSLTIASFVGLLFAIAGSVLLLTTISTEIPAVSLSIVALCLIAAVIAGRVILGGARVHRYFRLGISLLSAIAAIALTSATSNGLLGAESHLGARLNAPSSAVITVAIVGFVLYLVAATIYGFASAAQGVPIGVRIGYLALLLLAVIPILNVLGLIGLLIVALTHTPRITPAPPAASA